MRISAAAFLLHHSEGLSHIEAQSETMRQIENKKKYTRKSLFYYFFVSLHPETIKKLYHNEL
jgi:hypothetical protein